MLRKTFYSDQFASLQAAVTAAAGHRLVVYGNYTLTSAVTVSSNTEIMGDGFPVLSQGANDINIFALDDAINVRVRGIKFNGNSFGATASSNVNCAVESTDTTASLVKNCIVQECEFVGFYSWPVYFSGAAAGNYSFGVTIQNNKFTSQIDEGIALNYIKRALVRGNRFYSHAKEAIKATTAENIDIFENQIYNAATGATDGPLINVGTDCAKIKIIGNTCNQGNIGIGIEKRVTEVQIIGNLCYGQGQGGIGVASTSGDTSPMKNVIIAGNAVLNAAGESIYVNGISGQEAQRVVITGNIVDTNTGTHNGIQALNCVDAVISGNDVDTATKQGIIASSCTTAIISNNRVKSSQQHGIQLATVTNGTVVNNTVIDPNRAAGSNNGIQIESTCTTVTVADNTINVTSGSVPYGIRNQAATPIVRKNVVIGTASTQNVNWTIPAFGSQDTTPSVANIDAWKTNNSAGATSVTTFDDGQEGQIVTIFVNDNNTTFVDGATLILAGSVNWAAAQTDVLIVQLRQGIWYEISRSDNS